MTTRRWTRFFAVTALAVAALTGCKGGGSPGTANATFRVIQGNPSLGTIDYRIDTNGAVVTGLSYVPTGGAGTAPLSAASAYQSVTPAGHTISLFATGTTTAVGPGACPTPSFGSGSENTLVLANVYSGGTTTTPCVFFTEPAVTVGSGQAFVVYHDTAGNPNVPATLYPMFCQATIPESGCQVQTSYPLTNAGATGSGTAVVVPVSFSSATSGNGIVFTVATSPTATTPLCFGQANDPAFYPRVADTNNTSNFMPFTSGSTSDTTLALFVVDGAPTGSNNCPIATVGTFTL